MLNSLEKYAKKVEISIAEVHLKENCPVLHATEYKIRFLLSSINFAQLLIYWDGLITRLLALLQREQFQAVYMPFYVTSKSDTCS